MFRLVMAVVIMISTSLIGLHLSLKLKKREETLSLFLFNLETALSRVEYTKSTVYEMFENFTFDEERPFCPQWEELLVTYRYHLSKADINILKEFGESLGSDDEESELNRIRLYIAMLKDQLCAARSDCQKKTKLFQVGSFSAGMALSLLLI